MQIKIKFKKLSENAVIPQKNNPSDAGIDFYSTENVLIKAGSSACIGTGIAWQPDTPFCYLQMKGRSGLCFKKGLELCNAGVIDSGYTGEIRVLLHNTLNTDYEIKEGDKIAQGIVFPLPELVIEEVSELDETDRGANGFGSSGR